MKCHGDTITFHADTSEELIPDIRGQRAGGK
jgi:hypothetical protein